MKNKGQKTLNHDQLVWYMRECCEEEGGAAPWAKKNKISFSYACAVLRKDVMPGKKILKALKARKVTFYQVAEIPQKIMLKFEDV